MNSGELFLICLLASLSLFSCADMMVMRNLCLGKSRGGGKKTSQCL